MYLQYAKALYAVQLTEASLFYGKKAGEQGTQFLTEVLSEAWERIITIIILFLFLLVLAC